MDNWIPISPSKHSSTRYLPRSGYGFTLDMKAVPIMLAELNKLMPHFAISFIKQVENFQPVVITGFWKNNLYLNHDGKWLGDYIPAVLRGYPFALIPDNQRAALCIHKSHLTEDAIGLPLFDEQLNLSEGVQQTLSFLEMCRKEMQITQNSTNMLQSANVLQPWNLEIKNNAQSEPDKISGLFKADENILNKLDADTFAGLRQYGAVLLAYAQILSMSQLDQIVERIKIHEAQKPKENIDPGFSLNDERELDIDWDQI
jgi:hypothetical protein